MIENNTIPLLIFCGEILFMGNSKSFYGEVFTVQI